MFIVRKHKSTYDTIEECEKEIIGIWHARCYETDSR